MAARSQLAVRHPHSLFHSTVLLFVRRPCPRELGRRFCLVVWALWLGCFGCSDESGLNTARIIFRPSHHSDRKERQMIFGSRKANFGCSFSPFIELSDRLCYHDFYFHGLNWIFFFPRLSSWYRICSLASVTFLSHHIFVSHLFSLAYHSQARRAEIPSL